MCLAPPSPCLCRPDITKRYREPKDDSCRQTSLGKQRCLHLLLCESLVGQKEEGEGEGGGGEAVEAEGGGKLSGEDEEEVRASGTQDGGGGEERPLGGTESKNGGEAVGEAAIKREGESQECTPGTVQHTPA